MAPRINIQPGRRAGGFTPRALLLRLLPLPALLLLWSADPGSSRMATAQNFQNNGFGGFNSPPSQGQGPGFSGQNYGSPSPNFQPIGTAAPPAARIAANGFNDGGIPPAPATAALLDSPGPEAETPAAPWPPLIARVIGGGYLMIPIGLCALIIMTLSAERMIALRRGRVIPKPFVRRFTECVEDGNLSYEEATSICDEFDCPVAEVFHAAVRRWGRPMLEVEQAVVDAGDRVGGSLRRFLRVFQAISNVTPLLGLLGTVTGMIAAFDSLSVGPGAGGDPLAAGISQALLTTAAGLSVAIPAYLAHVYFAAKSDRYLEEIDRLCQRVVECISSESLEVAKPTRRRKAA